MISLSPLPSFTALVRLVPMSPLAAALAEVVSARPTRRCSDRERHLVRRRRPRPRVSADPDVIVVPRNETGGGSTRQRAADWIARPSRDA